MLKLVALIYFLRQACDYSDGLYGHDTILAPLGPTVVEGAIDVGIFDFPSKVTSETNGLGPRLDVDFLLGWAKNAYLPANATALIVLNQHQRTGKEGKGEFALAWA